MAAFIRSCLITAWRSSVSLTRKPLQAQTSFLLPKNFYRSPSSIQAASENVMEKLLENNAVNETDTAQCMSLIEYLLSLKISSSALIKTFKDQPKYINKPIEAWSDRMRFLYEQGFNPSMALKLLHLYPKLWFGAEDQLCGVLEGLRRIGFADGQLQRYILRCDNALQLTPNSIQMSYQKLSQYFSSSNSLRVIMNNEGVLSLSPSDLEERLMYVFTVMGIDDDEDIISSSLFNYSLFDLKVRHTLLERAGLYEKPNKKGETKIINPKLAVIMKTTDSEFAQDICHMSELEVQTFAKLYLRELNPAMNEDEDEESEEESEDEEEPGTSYKKR